MNFKIFFLESDNIRRFKLPESVTYEEFVSFLTKLYGGLGLYTRDSSVRYRDAEGDAVCVGSQLEWEEMLWVLKGEKVIKLQIVSRPRSPAAPACVPPPSCPAFSLIIPSLLQAHAGDIWQLFPPGLPRRFAYHFLFRQGLEAFDRSPADARAIFAALCDMQPDNSTNFYNLACAESLLGHIDAAAQALGQALEVGYSNLGHLLADPDLVNLKTHAPQLFAEICARLQPKGGDSAQQEEKVAEGPSVAEVAKAPEVKEEKKEEKEEKVVIEEEEEEVKEEKVVIEEEEEEEEVKEEKVVIEEEEEEEEVKEEKVEIGTRWGKELAVLRELGFLDDNLLIQLLEQTNGALERVIEILL